MTIKQVLDKAVRGVFSKPEVACTLRIAGSKPGYTDWLPANPECSVSPPQGMAMARRWNR